MPTLTSKTLDTFDLDYFYEKCSDSFGVSFYKEDPNNIRPIPPKSKPISCLTKILRNNTKITYFLFTSKTFAITKCLCGNYHTKFISASNTEYNISPSIFTTLPANSDNKKTRA